MEVEDAKQDLEVGQVASGCLLADNGMPGREWIGRRGMHKCRSPGRRLMQ